jgi:PAS domain S-box-containing protein
MSLRLRIHINTILTIVLILAIVALVFVQYEAQRRLLIKDSILQDLTREMVTLSFVTSDYLTFLNERSQAQWQNQFQMMQTLSRENDEIASALAPYFAAIDEKFNLLLELAASIGDAEISADRQVILRHGSIALHLALQETGNELDILQNATQTELLRIQKNTLLGTIAYFFLLSGILIAVANTYIRFILRPLNQLMKGVTELESGNFGYVLPVDSGPGAIQSSNELGQLAVAFNRMAKQLHLTLADLQQELETNFAITERLRASENQFRTIFNIASLGIAQADPATGRLLAVNECYQSITGYTTEELLSMTIQDITHPDDRGADWEGFSRAMREDDSYVTEKRYLRKDGAVIWVRLNVAFIRNNSGEAVSTVAICEDITKQRQSATALSERTQLLSEILDADPSMVYLVDNKDRLVMANHTMVSIYQNPLDQLIGKTLDDFAAMGLISQKNADTFQSHNHRVIETQQNLFIEAEPAQLADSKTVWFQTLLTPFNQPGKPPMVLGVSSNITARKHAEDSLRESEEKMRSIFRVAPTGIGVVNDRVIMEVNPRICEMTGYTKEELIGQNARFLYPTQEDYEFVGSEKYRQIAEGGTGEVETRWLTKDGTIKDILLASTPLDTDELSKGVIFTALDITERKKAEEYVRNMNVVLEDMVQNRTQELQKANEELRSFAYSISHDLRAPLRAIDGFSRILIEEYADQLTAEAQRYLNLCRENAITMGKLIEGLLEYSRTGRQGIHLQMVEPETLVRTVLADLEHEYPDHPAKVNIGKLPACLADAMLLKQVYQNLLQNAFKFTSKKISSQIDVGCDKMEQQTVYYVKDNGVGFDMRYADRLFGVFQRLHGMSEYKGTGIGLAIVQRIIHRLGGEIWCEAEVDSGATFYFTINPTEGLAND